jgi:hypothetical protein
MAEAEKARVARAAATAVWISFMCISSVLVGMGWMHCGALNIMRILIKFMIWAALHNGPSQRVDRKSQPQGLESHTE